MQCHVITARVLEVAKLTHVEKLRGWRTRACCLHMPCLFSKSYHPISKSMCVSQLIFCQTTHKSKFLFIHGWEGRGRRALWPRSVLSSRNDSHHEISCCVPRKTSSNVFCNAFRSIQERLKTSVDNSSRDAITCTLPDR